MTKSGGTPIGTVLNVYDDSTVYVQGVDYGGKMTVVARNKASIVVKVAGHKRWAGVGSDWKYEPPRLLVFVIDSNNGPEGHATDVLRVHGLTEVSLARGAMTS